ncbi:MAG: ATP-binding protein, partial [Duncaniella sp.]|nr:ATP-binding protein [Duncaniella sp.]
SERYNIGGKDLLAGNFKIYANDQAYHNYLFPTVRFGAGYLLENMVYVELLRKGYRVNTGILRNHEIDFVAVKDTRTLYIQVAYMLVDDTTAEREYSALEAIKGSAERLLVTLDDFRYPVRNSIHHLRPWELTEVL